MAEKTNSKSAKSRWQLYFDLDEVDSNTPEPPFSISETLALAASVVVFFLVLVALAPSQEIVDTANSRSQPSAGVNTEEGSEIRDRSREDLWIIKGKESVSRKLIDAHFGSVWFSNKSGHPVACGRVTGRNYLGGYADYARFIAADRLVTIETEGDDDFEWVWDKFC